MTLAFDPLRLKQLLIQARWTYAENHRWTEQVVSDGVQAAGWPRFGADEASDVGNRRRWAPHDVHMERPSLSGWEDGAQRVQ